MIEADQFIEHLKASSHTFVSGVPCSFLTPFINRVIDSPDLSYLPAASEGEAVGINLGAYLAGRKTVTLCQNSGLGNMINPLTSLNYPFKVPSLLIVTWRGEPGRPDEPQHELMGRVTHNLLKTIEVPVADFPDTPETIKDSLQRAVETMQQTQLPYAYVMRKGTVQKQGLESAPTGDIVSTNWIQSIELNPSRPTRTQALERLLELTPDHAAVIATTGKTGRELYTVKDRAQHLYVVGGMGTASAIALGVAVNAPQRPVIVIDGDGAALMKLGTMATIGASSPKNLIHILLDNEVHDSTGGQATVGRTTRFAKVAAAANYRNAGEAHSLDEFGKMLSELIHTEGPSLIHLKIQPGSPADLGRPAISPAEVKERFMKFLQSPVS